jgi:hypothetical protein
MSINNGIGWIKGHGTAHKYPYCVNCSADTRMFHTAILAAIANGGQFGEDLADIFKLTKCPPGSAAAWALDFA